MASVYAAEHEADGRRVALKLLSPQKARDPHLVARFLQEAQALGRVRHPGVVGLLDCARHGDTAFLVLEWLQGMSLREWMAQQAGQASLQTVRALGTQLADILGAVHAQGIVHRDLTPGNVFLCPDAHLVPGYRVRLLDFGIAKLPPLDVDALGPTQVQTYDTAPLGTYPYMAPEQFRSTAHVGPSADVYSLGVLLFELLAGRRPFTSEDPAELLSAHLSAEPPPLGELVPTLPDRLCAFIASMLDKEPGRRPTMSRCRDMLGRPWEDLPDTCPVPGLSPFTEAQAELLFGRDAELQSLLALLEESATGARRWVQVEGPSGVGKSSLLQAGVLPRLTPSTGWHVVCFRPRDEPIRALARALASGPLRLHEGETAETVERALRSGAGGLRDFAAAHTPKGERLLLVLEPLEELFTLGASECHALDGLLGAALDSPDSPVRLLTSVRADFLHRLEQVPTLARQLPRAARFPLLPMGPEALTQVIQGLARHTGLRLEAGLADRMVQDARNEMGGLPLLAQALRGLWTLSGGAPLTHAHYERLGRVGGALAQQAESLLASLGPEGGERARWMILSLVRTGQGGPDTRRPRSLRDVLAAGGGDALAERVWRRLSGMAAEGPETTTGLRLLQMSEGPDPTEQRVELVHEVLLLRVPSIAGWIEQTRAALERHAALEGAAQEWHVARCPEDELPTGSLLAHYWKGAVFAHGPDGRRESLEVERYLQAAERLARRRLRTRRLLVAGAALAVLIILFYAALADHERMRARVAQAQAEKSLTQLITRIDAFAGDSDWTLSWMPYTRDVRETMLNDFRDSLEKLTAAERGRIGVRRVAIKLFQRLADFAFHDGLLIQAERFLDEAEAELGVALAELPGDVDLSMLRALQDSKRGKVDLARGRVERACTHFRHAVRELERLGAKDKAMGEDRRTLAVSVAELAECDIHEKTWTPAAAHLDRAIQLHEQAQQGAVSYYDEALLAEVLSRRAEVARGAGESGVARGFHERALKLGRRSFQGAPVGDQYTRWVLARVLVASALSRLAGGQGQDAARLELDEARTLAVGLREGAPFSKRHALVWLDAVAGQEGLASDDRPLAMRLHTERCSLARDFQARDGQDTRFVFADCP